MFRIIQIVVYDVGGCHMSVVIDPGEVDCFCGCVMNFMMFLAYFQDNNQDIITIQMVYNAVIQHNRGFLKHMVISVTEKGRITVV